MGIRRRSTGRYKEFMGSRSCSRPEEPFMMSSISTEVYANDRLFLLLLLLQ